jgi:hypothetical protein
VKANLHHGERPVECEPSHRCCSRACPGRLDPGRAVARIARQAESCLKFSRPKVSSVTILFNSRGGLMPPAFERELKAALS